MFSSAKKVNMSSQHDPKAPHPNSPASEPVGPEPTIDTTKREAPGPRTQGPLTRDGDSDTADRPHTESLKLPHERDQSVDMTHGNSDEKVEQAYVDVQRGLKDTSRGPEADKAYQKQKT